MSQVFISYSRKDLAFVEQLASNLKAAGLDVWYDLSGLEGGARWRIEIEKAIRASQYVLVVLSPDSVVSEWVEEERLFAKKLQKKIIPLFYRQCDLTLGYHTLHYIDVQGHNYKRNFREILRSLGVKLIDREVERAVGKKAAQEKPEKESAEKAAREKAEWEATQKVTRERTEWEAAEKAGWEKARQEAVRRAEWKKTKQEGYEITGLDKITTSITTTITSVLLCGCPGIFMFIFGLSAAVGGGTITLGGTTQPMPSSYGYVFLCLSLIFILIPILVGFFTLRKPKAAATPAPVSDEPVPPAS